MKSTRILTAVLVSLSSVVWAQNAPVLPPTPPVAPVAPYVPPVPSTVSPPLVGSNPGPAPEPTTSVPVPMMKVPSDIPAVPALSTFEAIQAKILQQSKPAVQLPASPIRTATVIDEILVDYNKAKNFADFMRAMGSKVLPGDDVFLGQKIYLAPEILKVRKMPVLTYVGGNILIRSGKGESVIRPLDLDNLDFEVNHQKIPFAAYTNAGVRWARISEAITMGQQQAWISFLPVAYAVENGNLPTLSTLMAFSIISRISRSMARLTAHVLVDKTFYEFADIWKKSIEYRSVCSGSYMERLAQKVSEIGVATLTCNNNEPAFELPISEDARRVYKLKNKEIEVSGFGLDKPLHLVRDYKMDQDLDYISSEQKGEARRNRSERMKGLKWKPVGSTNSDDLEAAEHIRELTATIINGDLCRRCGLFFKHAAHAIREETDPDTFTTMSAAPGVALPTPATVPVVAPPAATPPTAPTK